MTKQGKENVTFIFKLDGVEQNRKSYKYTIYLKNGKEVIHTSGGYFEIQRENGIATYIRNAKTLKVVTFAELHEQIKKKLEEADLRDQ